MDEPLQWHSTISRTRQLFPEDVFEEVFTRVFKLYVEAGLVSGHIFTVKAVSKVFKARFVAALSCLVII